MFGSILSEFNWLDIFIIIVLIRVCYIAGKTGFSVEIFKLLGSVAAIYLGLHYYAQVADTISVRSPGLEEQTPLQFVDFVSCAILAMAGYLASWSLRIAFYHFIKLEAVPNLNKWGGFILGLLRGFFTVGLIVFMLTLSGITYLEKSVVGSYSGKRLIQVAPDTYAWLWNNLTSKFMPAEKFNKAVLEVK